MCRKLMKQELIFVKSISWDEVFSLWEEQESGLAHWIEHYTRKGYSTWKEWRSHTIKEIDLSRVAWNLYEIKNPSACVPQFQAGPFRTWMKKYYGKERTRSFKYLAEIPEIRADHNIRELINNFPDESTMIGLCTGDAVTIIEGLHRGCAVALAGLDGVSIEKKVYLACAEYNGDIPLMGSEDSPT
jgi:hypothetical protein